MNEHKLTKMVPIRFIAMSWIPLFIMFLLPSGILFLIVKIILGFGVLSVIVTSFNSMWNEYGTLGAFVTENAVLFAALWFFKLPSWLSFIFILLIILSFATTFDGIKKANQLGISKLEYDRTRNKRKGDNTKNKNE
jgi:hypothetical protein